MIRKMNVAKHGSSAVVAVPSVIVFALGWRNVGGLTGALIGAVAGLLWILLLAFLIRRLSSKWRERLATAVLLAAAAILCIELGGGTFEYLLLSKAIATSPEWIVTLTSGPLAQQVILFFIVFNSLLEILVIPSAVLLNWNDSQRRPFVLAAAGIFYVVRIWTYLTFAPEYIAYGEAAFSAQLVRDLQKRMAVDTIRIAMMIAEVIFLFRASVLSPERAASRETPGTRSPLPRAAEERATPR